MSAARAMMRANEKEGFKVNETAVERSGELGEQIA
jgi:hypothetical protein